MNDCEDYEYEEDLFHGSAVTKLQAIMFIVSFASVWCLTKEATQQLLDIFSLILPDTSKLPRTLHKFSKYFQVPNTRPQFYCPTCGREL